MASISIGKHGNKNVLELLMRATDQMDIGTQMALYAHSWKQFGTKMLALARSPERNYVTGVDVFDASRDGNVLVLLHPPASFGHTIHDWFIYLVRWFEINARKLFAPAAPGMSSVYAFFGDPDSN